METPLPPDFKEFLALLNSAKIEYLVIGGYAVSFHGYPRPTGDLDIWIAIPTDHAASILKVLASFGFGAAGATPEAFLTPGFTVRMGHPPVRIEIMNSISGVDFRECYSRRLQTAMDGVPVNIITREDLLANKRAAGREKDLNDLKHLAMRRKTT
jgi:predicted nucleotidyltransferase